uniref:V-type proton ATPase subunit D n=1 Tax=Felis catus TaxID=9685 RepID=A0ABI8AAC6_FELCA
MSGKDRIEIFPSRMAQTIMKARLKGAQTGRNLLKKKSDALTLRFRQILKKIIEVPERKSTQPSLVLVSLWKTLLKGKQFIPLEESSRKPGVFPRAPLLTGILGVDTPYP